jgi:hypothetical protein
MYALTSIMLPITLGGKEPFLCSSKFIEPLSLLIALKEQRFQNVFID